MSMEYTVVGTIIGTIIGVQLTTVLSVAAPGAYVVWGVGAVIGFAAWYYSPLPNRNYTMGMSSQP